MMRSIFTLLLTVLSLSVYGQDYSYSFKGELDPVKREQLESSIDTLEGVDWAKIRYKEEAEKGEILFKIEVTKTEKESQTGFSPIVIKKLIIDNGLEPMDLIELKAR
jgi:hypothetical protein